MWSAPFRIIVALVLLYQQLGVASIIGALFLVLMFPIQVRISLYSLMLFALLVVLLLSAYVSFVSQFSRLLSSSSFSCFILLNQTIIISKTQKLTKEGLQRTDKRIGLMNEVLAAMDTVKYDTLEDWNLIFIICILEV